MLHLLSFEWIHFRKSTASRISIVVCFILIGIGLYLGNEKISSKESTIAQLRTSEALFYSDKFNVLQQIEKGGAEPEQWWHHPANPLVLSEIGQAGKYVAIDTKPLASFALGQLDIFPYYGKVKLNSVEMIRENALENPFLQISGNFDVAFVIVWLIPLFVIAIGYNIISSERENGTFRLLQSQPITINRILLYKLVFRYFLMLISVILSLVVWSTIFSIDFFNIDFIHLILAISGYTAFWFLLCAFFNLFKTSSAVNAVGLVGLWVLFLLMIPAILSHLASHLHPVPSRALWITEQREIHQTVYSESDKFFDSWKADHPGEFIVNDVPQYYNSWLRRLTLTQTIKQRENSAELKFHVQRDRQAAFISRYSFISPPLMMQSWMEKLAGSDARRLRSLTGKLLTFQKEWQDFFLPRFQKMEFLTSGDYESIPSP